MAKVFLLLALALAGAMAKNTFSPYWGEYNTTAGPVEGKINVHLVPHTHDDTGWLVTVDQYYQTEVTYILDTVLDRLLENPDRKFIYVETGFFERWWIQQSKDTQDKFKTIVANGQLEFVNGGWCMHDEAAPHYVEMVDNTARGHQFLLKNFGIAPKGTWQIDPFGHTNTQGWLIGQYSGMQYLYFGRMDYQDFNMRKNLSSMVAPGVPRSLEWVWQGSKTFGNQYQTFTGELYGGGGGGYGSPDNLDFDGTDNQVQDDPRFHDYNLDNFVETFVSAAQDQAAHMRSNHIMWAMGSDFNYQNADHWYKNIDKLIYHINKNGTVNAFYSTPTIYTQYKHAANLTWEARFDDVMPLADNAHHYWTGYFTSRQSLKKYLRVLSNYLSASRQLALLFPSTLCPTTGNTQALCTDNLEANIAITTHHDGLSGTEKQAVADDYAQRMAEGEAQTLGMVAEILSKQLNLSDIEQCHGHLGLNISFCTTTTQASQFTVIAYNPQGQSTTQMLRIPVGNGTAYTVTTGAGSSVNSQLIPLTQRDYDLSTFYLQFPEYNNPAKVDEYTNKAKSILTFAATIPPVGWQTFIVKQTAETPAAAAAAAPAASAKPKAAVSAPSKDVPVKGTQTLSNGVYSVTFDSTTGSISSITNLLSGVSANVAMDIGFYNASIGGCTPGVGSWKKQRMNAKAPGNKLTRGRREEYEFGMDEPVMLDSKFDDVEDSGFACDDQRSGAYIFRPNSTTVFPAACTLGANTCNTVPTITIKSGPIVSEAYITYSDWATVVVRLAQNMPYVEVEYTVGPIPLYSFEDPANPYLQGKEVVLRYNTSLNSNGVVYADSNAREMVQRTYNKRGPSYPNPYQISEPAAGNYYPVNALIAIEDPTANVSFSVAVDRSMGGASMASGSVELMVHRRTQQDDSRGVGQPMNETMCGCNDQDPANIGQCPCVGLVIRGTNYLILDNIPAANRARRVLSENLNFGATLAFSTSTNAPAIPSYSAISAALPENVKLMTLGTIAPQYNDKVYLRLAHLYEAGEHPTLAQPVTVNLQTVFAKAGFTIKSATEVSLTGNQTPAQLQAQKLVWPVVGEDTQMPAVDGCEAGKPCTEKATPFDASTMTVVLRPMDIRTFVVKF